jgi:tripartite-type tricarboxylate transporter receptor subunit TctC
VTKVLFSEDHDMIDAFPSDRAFKSGSKALTEVISEGIEYYFCPVNTALPFIQDGKLKALAVSTPKRVAALPDVPSSGSRLQKLRLQLMGGPACAQQNTARFIDRLNQEIADAPSTLSLRGRLIRNGSDPLIVSPAALDAQIAQEIKINAILANDLSLKLN